MKPGTRERRQHPAAGGDEESSRNQLETGAARDGGLTGVVDEELEFFDTVGVESQHAIDAFSFAGVRVRH